MADLEANTSHEEGLELSQTVGASHSTLAQSESATTRSETRRTAEAGHETVDLRALTNLADRWRADGRSFREESKFFLHFAVEREDSELVRQILENVSRGFLERAVDRNGFKVGDLAVRKGYWEIFRTLLDMNPAILGSVLVAVARRGDMNSLEEMLRRFPSTNPEYIISEESKATALYHAANQGHLIVVRKLLTCVQACTGQWNPLHAVTIGRGRIDIAKLLLKLHPDLINWRDNEGNTILHLAVEEKKRVLARYFLKKQPLLISEINEEGDTALHTAAKKKLKEMVEELLTMPNIDVNAVNNSDMTALDIINTSDDGWASSLMRRMLIRRSAMKGRDLYNSDSHMAREMAPTMEKSTRNATNTASLVAVLIATLAFQAVFQVPGGLTSEGAASKVHTPGFNLFLGSISAAFFISLVVVMFLSVYRPTLPEQQQVAYDFANYGVFISACFCVLAYIAAVRIVTGPRAADFFWYLLTFCSFFIGCLLYLMCEATGYLHWVSLLSLITSSIKRSPATLMLIPILGFAFCIDDVSYLR